MRAKTTVLFSADQAVGVRIHLKVNAVFKGVIEKTIHLFQQIHRVAANGRSHIIVIHKLAEVVLDRDHELSIALILDWMSSSWD
mgnify:CR=1 FL=1